MTPDIAGHAGLCLLSLSLSLSLSLWCRLRTTECVRARPSLFVVESLSFSVSVRSDSNLSEACPSCADGCSGIWDHWKSSAARVLGGNWFSTYSVAFCDIYAKQSTSTGEIVFIDMHGAGTAQEGNCDDPSAPGCSWRALEHLKTVNASCANDNLIATVENRGAECFSNGACQKLSDGSYNRSTNCWVKCFFSAVLGPTPHLNASMVPWKPLPAMTSEELTRPWLAAFLSEDEETQGCRALPPPAV